MGAELNNDILSIIPKTVNDKIIDFIIQLGIIIDDKWFLEAIAKDNSVAVDALIKNGLSVYQYSDYICQNFQYNYLSNQVIRHLIKNGLDFRSNNYHVLFQFIEHDDYRQIFLLIQNGLILRSYIKKICTLSNVRNYFVLCQLHRFLQYYDKDEYMNVAMSSECKDIYVSFIIKQYENTKCKINTKLEELNFGIF